jgi:hypothetical protein
MAENFDLIFGQNASQQYAWNDTDYQNGWETIGNIPPTAAQFDALQRRSDTKMKELNDELTPLVNADTADSRQPSTVYSVDDIKYSPLLPTGWFLTCTVAGTTAAGELVLPTPIAENDTVTDGTVTWEIHKIGTGNGGDGVPLGAIIAYSANGELPSGYLLCDGSAVSRTMFPDLFSAIGTTYGAGDGTTTFNLPDYSDGRFPEGSTVAGVAHAAGLPNITGYAGAPYVNIDPLTGAFYSGDAYGGAAGGGNLFNRVYFDASRSSAIYGASNTVQPNALTCRYIIKAFDGQTADSALIDITQYAQELASKANINGSNLVHHRDVITTSGTYTAPVTGMYKITVKGGGGGGFCGSPGSGSDYLTYGGAGGGEGGITLTYAKLNAGDSVAVVIGAGGTGAINVANPATAGGDSSVAINGTTYTAGGGGVGVCGGIGGAGTIPGAPGEGQHIAYTTSARGSSGGGAGGGVNQGYNAKGSDGTSGGGGGGGSCSYPSTVYAGGAGGNGYVWFEYYTPGSN